jgi:hypothetical protein
VPGKPPVGAPGVIEGLPAKAADQPEVEAVRREDRDRIRRQLEQWPPNDPLRLIAWAILVEKQEDYESIAQECGYAAGWQAAGREIIRRLGLDEG